MLVRSRGPELVVVLGALLFPWMVGCTGSVDDSGRGGILVPGGPLPGGPVPTNGAPGGGPVPGLGSADGQGAATADDPRIAERIWRLSPGQLDGEVRLLFGDGVPGFELAESAAESGITNIAANAVVDPGNAALFDNAARAIASWVTANGQTATRCPAYGSEDCIDVLLEWLLPAAFRRPVSAEETAQLRALFQDLRAGYDYDHAIGGVVRAVLLSPDFLYRSELGDGSGVLSPYEIANLLAFAVTDRSPDPELLAAAERGELQSPDGREAQVRRLMGQSHGIWHRLLSQWLALDTLDSQGAEVGLDPLLVEQMWEEFRAFVSDVVVARRGTLRELLTAPYTWTRPELAAHYGVAHPGGGLARVELDPAERAGLLTQGAWLVSHGKAGRDNVVRRGMNLFKQAMCNNNLAPPDGLDVNAELLALVGLDATVRETVDARASAPTCGACHRQADPMGIVFEQYASDGRPQSLYADGEVVDNRASLPDLGDFDSAPAFAAALADDVVLQSCFVRRVTHYLMGIDMGSPSASAWVQRAHAAFVQHDTSLEELLVAIVRQPGFVERVKEPSP